MAKQVSSSLTLFWRIAVPTMWVSFFGVFTLAIFFSNLEYYGSIPGGVLKILIPIVLLIGLIIMNFTLLKLRRIDMDDEFIYATNYLKTYKYPWQNVEKIENSKGLIFSTGIIHLKTPGKWGNKIMFLKSKKRWRDFLSTNSFKLKDYVG